MNEATLFGVAVMALVIACVAEHFMKPALFERLPRLHRIALFVVRTLMAVFSAVVLMTTPSCRQATECQVDFKAQHSLGDC